MRVVSQLNSKDPHCSDLARFRKEWHRRRVANLKRAMSVIALFMALMWISGRLAEINFTALSEGLPNGLDYFRRLTPTLAWATLSTDLLDWFWGWHQWSKMLGETVAMAFVGTFLGAIFAIPAAAAGAQGLGRGRWSPPLMRRALELARSVPEVVLAFLFVFSFGLGPFAGVLAIAVHTWGSLGKLLGEVFENIDRGPVEAIDATGGTWSQAVRFGALPQILPLVTSHVLLRFEINVRSAAALGLVGAGGIGSELYTVIRQFIYSDISAILIMILALVMSVSILCDKLRRMLDEGVNRHRISVNDDACKSPDADYQKQIVRRSVKKVRLEVLICSVFLATLFLSLLWILPPLPQLIGGLAKFWILLGLMMPPSPNGWFLDFSWSLLQTLAMAFVGTVVAAAVAVPLSCLAASNVVGRLNPLRFLVRRMFDIMRSIDGLVWALIFVGIVGLGPFAGVLAIAFSDIGALGKIFSEALESAEEGPSDGIRSTGANSSLIVRFSLVPQALPVFISSTLYFFESNVRSATILGVVGAGGIGFELADRIRINNWEEASFIILMILATVAVVDLASRRVRLSLIGSENMGQKS